MLLTAKYSKSYLTKVPDFAINSEWILNERGPKNVVDTREAYAYLVEDEYDINGVLTKVAQSSLPIRNVHLIA